MNRACVMAYREQPTQSDYSAAWRRYRWLRFLQVASAACIFGVALALFTLPMWATLGLTLTLAFCHIMGLGVFRCPRCDTPFDRERHRGMRMVLVLKPVCPSCQLRVGE